MVIGVRRVFEVRVLDGRMIRRIGLAFFSFFRHRDRRADGLQRQSSGTPNFLERVMHRVGALEPPPRSHALPAQFTFAAAQRLD